MTIAAAYLVSEGVVLGADSSTTISVRTPEGVGGVLQVLSHAQKVFEVGENSRIGVCTWGAGSVGDISHRTIVARLADKIEEGTTIKDAAEGLGDILVPLVNRTGVEFVGYYLGGWDPVSHDPACFKIEVTQSGGAVDPLPLGLCSFPECHFFHSGLQGFRSKVSRWST